MGNTVYHFGTGGSNLGGPGLQLRGSVRDTVGSLMVLGTSRSSLYHEENGTHMEVYHEVTNLAIRRACGMPYNGNYYPRSYLVE